MKPIIIDSSFACSLFTNQQLKPALDKELIRYENNIFSQPLLLYEVSNALRFFYRSTTEIVNTFDLCMAIGIQFLHIDLQTIRTAIQISVEVSDTVYDASYHALAIHHNFEFVTLDKKYYQKAQYLGNIRLFA